MTAEPDQDVTPALGAALAEPVPPAQPLLELWRLAGGGTTHYQPALFAELMCAREPALRGVTDTGAITAAVSAERERIAQIAEDIGAHYHERLERTRGRSAPFADYLRSQSATTTQQQGAPR